MYTDYRPRSTGPVSRYRLVQAWDWFKVFTHRHSSVHNTRDLPTSSVKVAQIPVTSITCIISPPPRLGHAWSIYNTIVIILPLCTSPFILNSVADTQRVAADGFSFE